MQEEKKKDSKIKNKYYRAFLDGGFIRTIEIDDIISAFENINGKYEKQHKTFLSAIYYSGARPNEVLNLVSENVKKIGNYVHITLPPSKSGLPRTIIINIKKPLIKEFYKYCLSMPPNTYLFFSLRNKYLRTKVNKNRVSRDYIEITGKLGYYFKKWFGFLDDPISPYYLRHNRFSKLSMKGASTSDIRMLKGSKTDSSVFPYLHMSQAKAKKIEKMMD